MSRKQSDQIDCPSQHELLAFRDGALPDERFSEVEHHLASCETCVTTLTRVDLTPAYVDSDIVTDDENFAEESECQATWSRRRNI